ncbi:MAG TPA: hypothetical protein PKA13_07685 [Geminicoccaceae bacterium]|nr:hypothetical protein [Geminicoccus sp.]HMU49640.1 hypothetical protein [Geminicoccaceae bacterium]
MQRPSIDEPIAQQASGLAAVIAAAEARAAAGDAVDLAGLATLIDQLASRTASADAESRRKARASLMALLAGASSLVDTLDRQSDELRGQLVTMRRGRTAGRAYRSSASLQR